MRRCVQILGLVVLALAASGWSSMMAAVLCPHAMKTLKAESMTDNHACCAAKTESVAKPHCHDSAMEQEAADGMETPEAVPVAMGRGEALSLPYNVPCTHCMGRPEVPASNVIALQPVEQRRSLEPAAAPAAILAMPSLSFTQPPAYRQGAPPGSHTPKHLLISVLLI